MKSRIAGLAVLAVLMALVAAFPAGAAVPEPPKTPTVEGYGGSASSVDPLATQTAIKVLRRGGNAVDAAVAAAGVLGVTEPFSCGIGGGGFMVIYDAKRHKGRHDRLSRGRAGGMTGRVLDPDRLPSRSPRPRSAALASACPAPWRAGRPRSCAIGTRPLRALPRPTERRARGLRRRSDLHGQVSRQRGRFDDIHLDARALPPGRRSRRAVGSTSATPTSPTTYERIGARHRRASTAGGRARHRRRPSSTRRWRRLRPPGTRCARAA